MENFTIVMCLKANFRVRVMTYVGDKAISKSKDFYSKKSKDQLIAYVLDKVLKSNESKNSKRKYEITIFDKLDNNKSKTLYTYVDDNKNILDTINNTIKNVFNNNNCIDIKANKFRVSVINRISISHDKKSTVVISKDSINKVHFDLVNIFDKIQNEYKNNNIIFSEPTSKYSHRVNIVKYSVVNKKVKLTFKCFSIAMHDYSSLEVLKLMSERILEVQKCQQ